MPKKKYDFYSWYAGLHEKQKNIEYLIDNVGSSRGITYDYKGGKTNQRYSIVEREAEELEKLHDKFWKQTNIILTVHRAMGSIIYENSLGYTVIKGKHEGKDIREVKGRHSLKACKEAEQKGIEAIEIYLTEENIKYDF